MSSFLSTKYLKFGLAIAQPLILQTRLQTFFYLLQLDTFHYIFRLIDDMLHHFHKSPVDQFEKSEKKPLILL